MNNKLQKKYKNLHKNAENYIKYENEKNLQEKYDKKVKI